MAARYEGPQPILRMFLLQARGLRGWQWKFFTGFYVNQVIEKMDVPLDK